jgi:hypothetical protein
LRVGVIDKLKKGNADARKKTSEEKHHQSRWCESEENDWKKGFH